MKAKCLVHHSRYDTEHLFNFLNVMNQQCTCIFWLYVKEHHNLRTEFHSSDLFLSATLYWFCSVELDTKSRSKLPDRSWTTF